MFALIDCNAFYCAAETVYRPDLRGKKLCVLSNNDGCVVAATPAAIKAGLKKFAPYFQQQHLIEKKGIHVFSSNYTLYAAVSKSVMATIGEFAPMHVYSIDEAFTDLRNMAAVTDHQSFSVNLRQTVWKKTRIPVSVGVGATLTLAKLASKISKNEPNPINKGVYVLDLNKQRCINQMDTMSVGDVWGVGRRLSKRLNFLGIYNVGQLRAISPKKARQIYSVELDRTVRELNGEICLSWDEVRPDKKQIVSSRTTSLPITNSQDLEMALAEHLDIAAAKARSQGSLVKVMSIYARSNGFDGQTATIYDAVALQNPTSDTTILMKVLRLMVERSYRSGIDIRKVQVGFQELIPKAGVQQDLLNPFKENDKLMRVYDSLNQRFGRHTVRLAAQPQTSPSWSMKREFLSPNYLTQWKDIPKVSC